MSFKYDPEQIRREIQSFQNSLNNMQQPQQQQQTTNSSTYRDHNFKPKENDIEFRDTINEKVNNLKFARPHQEKAQHFYDQNLIQNNPQYIAQQKKDEHVIRRDNRDSFNNKMDSFQFQRFGDVEIPSSIRVHEQQHQPIENNTNMNPTQSFRHNSSNKINNRELNNERMQSIFSLPRTLTQPSNSFGFDRNNYQNEYTNFNQTNTSRQFDQIYQTQNNNQPQNYHNQQYTTPQSVSLIDESILRKKESDRTNYKDSHNERLQGLSPLARTCAIPITTADYNHSVQQNTSLIIQGRNANNQNTDKKKDIASMQTSQWYQQNNSMQTPKVVIDTMRPMDTRQII